MTEPGSPGLIRGALLSAVRSFVEYWHSLYRRGSPRRYRTTPIIHASCHHNPLRVPLMKPNIHHPISSTTVSTAAACGRRRDLVSPFAICALAIALSACGIPEASTAVPTPVTAAPPVAPT